MDNKNNSNNPELDILGFLDQVLDTVIDKELAEACEKAGDPIPAAFIKLCMEYGIHGRKLMEFTSKMTMICNLTGGNKKEDEDN